MAQLRPLRVGFSSATRVARFQLGSLEVSFKDVVTGELLTFVLTEEMLRIIDLQVERSQHEDKLLTMNEGETGLTLWEAALAGGLRDTKVLLARKTSFHYWNVYHCSTAVMEATRNNHVEVVTALLDRRAHRLGECLYIAVRDGRMPLISLLLQRGADANHLTVLPLAAELGMLDAVGMLLDAGADIHMGDEQALHFAATRGHLEIVRLLLDRGAVVLQVSVFMARVKGHEAIAALLEQHQAAQAGAAN